MGAEKQGYESSGDGLAGQSFYFGISFKPGSIKLNLFNCTIDYFI